MKTLRTLAIAGFFALIPLGASAQCMSCAYQQAAQAYSSAAAKEPPDQPHVRACYQAWAQYYTQLSASMNSSYRGAQPTAPADTNCQQAARMDGNGSGSASVNGQGPGSPRAAAQGLPGTSPAGPTANVNIPGMAATSLALNSLSGLSNVSQGFANSVLGAGLAIDALGALFNQKPNADKRAPFDQQAYDSQVAASNSAINDAETGIEADRLLLATSPASSPIILSQANADLNSIWMSLSATAAPTQTFIYEGQSYPSTAFNNYDDATYAKAAMSADAAIDANLKQLDNDLTGFALGKVPSLALALSRPEIDAVLPHCSQAAFIEQAMDAKPTNDGARAALYDETARALDSCAQNATGELALLFHSWELYYLNPANASARMIAATATFDSTHTKILSLSATIIADTTATAKYKRLAYASWYAYCERNTPENGPHFPDYGRFELWSQWHQECDAEDHA